MAMLILPSHETVLFCGSREEHGQESHHSMQDASELRREIPVRGSAGTRLACRPGHLSRAESLCAGLRLSQGAIARILKDVQCLLRNKLHHSI